MKRQRIHVLPLLILLLLVSACSSVKVREQGETINISPTSQIVESYEPDTFTEVTLEDTEIIPKKEKNGEISVSITEEASAEVLITEEAPETKVEAGEYICTLTVRCDDVFSHLDRLNEGKEAILPESGFIFPKTAVTFSDGENVFDVLYREMKNSGIHMEFVKSPMYNSVYIEGIGNLYEFDCGSTSGWTYTVNGEMLMYGCSEYMVQKGDEIEFIYRCSL